MAAILTPLSKYASKFDSGGLLPGWPHFWLLFVSVLASFAVGAGIIGERPKYSPRVHTFAFCLVMGGIAVEALCTILLFVFDEGISQSQQSIIIGLDNALLNEQRITSRERMTLNWLLRAVAPRNVANDRVALIEALKKEDTGSINVAYVDKKEPHMLALQMVEIFRSAGIMGRLIILPSDAEVSGAFMNSPTSKEGFSKGFLADTTMSGVTNRSFTRIGSGGTLSLSVGESLPKDENTLVIGNNDPAFFGMDGQDGEGIDVNGRPLPP
jgi:hypothetical protein